MFFIEVVMLRWKFLPLVFVLSLLAISDGQEISNSSALGFVFSPSTKQHVQLQFQSDHHRVHFLTHAKNLEGVPCSASVVCTKDDKVPIKRQVSVSEVSFVPTTANQTFSVHIRVPRVTDTNANYVLAISAAGQLPAAYQWDIERNDKGEGVVKHQAPGTSRTVPVLVWKLVEESKGDETVFKIVVEDVVREISVPEGFKFGTSKKSLYKVSKPATPISIP